jgi:hypothetical protein
MRVSCRFGVLLVLAVLAHPVAIVRAQAPGEPAAVKKYSRSRGFRLPFTIDPSRAAEVSEVRLYVKTSPEQPWALKATAAPGQKSFAFVAPQDGEYAFLIATVDQAGRSSPADVSKEAPELIVVVNTQRSEPAPPAAKEPSATPDVRLTAAPGPALDPATSLAVESHADKPTPPPAPPRHLINSTHAMLNYAVEQQGATAVKLDVWLTSPTSRTWQKLCEVPGQGGPAEIVLPGEGVFGLHLAAGGPAGTGPAADAAPDFWVEVDTTPPLAQLQSVTPAGGPEGDGLLIRWLASDRNLGPHPISLYYATRPDGTWLPVAEGLANDGSYRWPAPRELGPVVYLRLDVADQAGNHGRSDLPQPFQRYALPARVRVLGISAAAPPGVKPQGN